MRLIKVAAVALNQTPLDWANNKRNILQAIDMAREQEAGVVCLPELCISGYGCEDAFHSPGVQQMSQRVLLEILPETRGMVVSLGLPVMHGGGLFNAVCLAADGKLLGLVAKQNLAGDGIHYEPRWFKRWPAGVRSTVAIGGEPYPIGDLLFDCGGVLLGFEICEDAWVARRPGSELSLQCVDVILNPSASHFAFGKQEIRRRFVLEGSRAFCVSYVYANLLGNEAGRAIYDGGTMIASIGKMLVEGRRFSFADVQMITAVVDVDLTRMQRAQLASFQPDVRVMQAEPIRSTTHIPNARPERAEILRDAWETGDAVKEEEFSRAVSLGLFDYLRKSRSRGFVVSLSGGADSSATVTLVSLLVQFAVEELGPAGLREKLSYISQIHQVNDPRQLLRQLLLCVYQSTRNSSETTRSAAASLAEALGADYRELDVDEIVERYTQLVSKAVGRSLTWEQDDIALQNIQARARAPGVWMLANVRGALLLSTSNRSEAAVGYATMDGDTAGGLSPIAGIDKAFLRRWLRWMCEHGPEGLAPLPVLQAVIDQQPTAELRPQSSGQTDEDDLMPYAVLDPIERAAIRDKHAPLEVLRLMEVEFPEYSRRQFAEWIERFFRLWTRNQWKRERYAPSFHLDDENLDPKTWCRFPILSGGFQRELAELWAAVERDEESPGD